MDRLLFFPCINSKPTLRSRGPHSASDDHFDRLAGHIPPRVTEGCSSRLMRPIRCSQAISQTPLRPIRLEPSWKRYQESKVERVLVGERGCWALRTLRYLPIQMARSVQRRNRDTRHVDVESRARFRSETIRP